MLNPIVLSCNLSSLLCSLDKRASILDLRVECQDLEKFSVINRFAKFHGRGQADGAEASSSSDAIVSAHKFFPRRYVTALPMPRNLPDRVQCLSLWSLINWFFPLFWPIVFLSLMPLWSNFFQLKYWHLLIIEPHKWKCRRRMSP